MTDTLPAVPGEFLLYETEDGRTRVECQYLDAILAAGYRVRAQRGW